MEHKLRSANDLSDLDMGVFIVREEIRKYKEEYNKLNESVSIHYGKIAAYDDCIEICDDLLDIATLGDIASTQEEL